VTLLAAIASTGFVHARMDRPENAAREVLRIPSPGRTGVLAMGFEPAIADYYWIQLLHLVGGTRTDITAHAEEIGRGVSLVTELDPWVDHPYRFGAIWLTRDVEDVRLANRLLRQAISYHPTDWRNRFYLGYNLFYYLQENAAAADVLEPAIGMEGAPTYLGPFVARLRATGSDLETSALFLETLIREAPDEYARAEYLKAYDEIATERRARQLDAARVLFWRRHGRDIRSAEELWRGPLRVLRAAPPPHPHFPGFHWEIDPETQEITSSFYGTRYRLHIHDQDRELRARWRADLAAEGEARR
jgi:tetratricopeptide (TPR) repeat protein